LVSIVVPAFNAEKTLGRCLEALKRSICSEFTFEIVVVDNNSTDRTPEIAARAGVLCLKEARQGRSWARNCGLQAAQGELVAFVDADVVVDPHWLALLVARFANPLIGGAQGSIVPDLENGSWSLNRYRYWRVFASTGGTFCLLHLMTSTFPMINSAACLYRAKILREQGGFDTHLVRHEDIDLSRRVFLSGHHLASVTGARATVIFHGQGWPDYLERSFWEGYWKGLYLQKWRRSPVVKQRRPLFLSSSQSRGGHTPNPPAFRPNFIESGFFALAKGVLLALNALGRLWGASFRLMRSQLVQTPEFSLSPLRVGLWQDLELIELEINHREIRFLPSRGADELD